jgi:LDH2 family malate/lactate/ureidoglycolate dehydrogenase
MDGRQHGKDLFFWDGQIHVQICPHGWAKDPRLGNNPFVISVPYKSIPENENVEICYPGQKIVQIRKENQEIGIPVNRKIWDKIMSL